MKNHSEINIKILSIAFGVWIVLLIAGCDKEISRSPVESEAPKGFIYVSSNPSGFTIFQNERNTGRLTPDSISYIESGVYEITLKKKYFKDTSLVVTLNEDDKLQVNIDIASNPSMYGNLSLQTSPVGAEIIINDSATGRVTPSTFIGLLPGEYRVRFKLFEHRDEEIITVVQSSKTNSYSEALRDTSVWVDYQVINSEIQSNLLYPILIDKNNNKWIGSYDAGLIKYDEVNFINYNTSNSQIPGNRVNCIAIDFQNRVWVGTDDGIGIFDGSTWIVYNSANSGLTSETINTIRFDNSGIFWIGTAANLVKFDGSNWTLYNEPAGKDWINDIYIQNENKLWLGTKADGIRIFENEAFDSLPQPIYGYPSNTISSIAADVWNNIWFCFKADSAGRGGGSVWSGTSFSNFYAGSFNNDFNNVFIDQSNNRWISTSEGLYDGNNFFTTTNSLISSNNVSASARDKNGNVWVTTSGGGLNKYKPPQ